MCDKSCDVSIERWVKEEEESQRQMSKGMRMSKLTQMSRIVLGVVGYFVFLLKLYPLRVKGSRQGSELRVDTFYYLV